MAKLWVLVWLVQIASSPQYGDGCGGGVLAALGVFGSRTVSFTWPAVWRVGIDGRHVVGALFERAVDGPVGIHGWIALVRRNLIVRVDLRIGPVPHRDDHVPLSALRTRRRGGRQLAGGDSIGPVRIHRQGARAADLGEAVAHPAAGLPCLNAFIPRLRGRLGGLVGRQEARASPFRRADDSRCSRRC